MKKSLKSKSSRGDKKQKVNQISDLLDGFVDYIEYELNYAPETVSKYKRAINKLTEDIGDFDVEKLEVKDFVRLKKIMIRRGVEGAGISTIVFAMRTFLKYCDEFLNLDVLDPKKIRPPRKFKREVIFLNKEEIEAFIETINCSNITGLRFRVLVETLLGTGMRIGEVLSLKRKDINWEKREAKIVGKGNKERKVFFTKRALDWINIYLEKRIDSHESIFITTGESPRTLNRGDIWRFFGRHRKMANIDKPLTPHILRHTVATNLLFNGCPISHVKEILGHERLSTTCKYYLGIDKSKAKEAHGKYINFFD
jgi:site-specific recombinase XerD